MALIFDRKEFQSGVMLIKEKLKDGSEKVTKLSPKDKGKEFSFEDEAAVLAKYPHCFKKK